MLVPAAADTWKPIKIRHCVRQVKVPDKNGAVSLSPLMFPQTRSYPKQIVPTRR